MIFLGLFLVGETAIVLILTWKSSSSIFLSKSASCCWEKLCFLFSCSLSFSFSAFSQAFQIFEIISLIPLIFFHSFISSAFFLIFFSQSSWRGSTKICIPTFSSLEILENADKILSIGSASKASYVLIGCTLSFVKVKFQPA